MASFIRNSPSSTNRTDGSPSSSFMSFDRLFDSTHPDRTRSWISLIQATTVIAASTYGSYKLYQLIQRYGVNGALRYIWEGDPYSLEIRTCIDTLDKVNHLKKKLSNKVSQLEESFERAKLDSIDYNAPSNNVIQLWKKYLPKSMQTKNSSDDNLRQRLALLSHDADKLAAMVDQVLASSSSREPIHILVDIRQRKKIASNEIVLLMERIDKLIDYFQKATEE